MQTVVTSHGAIALWDSGGSGVPLLFIHGNSSSSEVFSRQIDSELAGVCRLITFDLPGHGRSGNALDPFSTYTRPGLADVVVELLDVLAVRELVMLGWSLGGHIAIELVSRCPAIKGLVITGAPPVSRGGMADGFLSSSHLKLAGQNQLSASEIEEFARAIFGEPTEPFLLHAIARADGTCRERLLQGARRGEGVDQRRVVETSPVPIAVINGNADPLINVDYMDRVRFCNLWRGRCHRLEGGHATFWHAAQEFNGLVRAFLKDVLAR